MPAVVDSILRFKLFLTDSRFPGDRYLNVFHYRCSVGSLGEADFNNLAHEFQLTVWNRWKTIALDTTTPIEIRIGVIWETAGFEYVADVSGWGAGALGAVSTSPPQACACITRRSFKPGRKGIGRTFFGPLAEAYCDNGQMLVDPTLAPDATVLLDAIGDNLTYGGATFKPCITPAEVTASPGSLADIRTQAFAAKLTYLKSRRAGVGS